MTAWVGTAQRYWHTLRHLRPVQFHARARHRWLRPRVDPAPPPVPRGGVAPVRPWARREPSMTGPDAFVFLGVPGRLSEHGWTGEARELLWRYNQHYFDDLNARDAASRSDWHDALIGRWIADNPPAAGPGWDPYPTSLRIVNWIKRARAGRPLDDAATHSLAVQARWLSGRIEHHLLGNHLFANAKALAFTGLHFGGAEGDRWFDAGMRLVLRELDEQVLADGGHFERSPMYHALALEDVLDLINLAGACRRALTAEQAATASTLPAVARSMLRWLRTMCHPDREIAFFNDAAIGIAPSPDELAAYAARVLGEDAAEVTARAPAAARRPSATALAESGYVRVDAPDAALLVDVAPVGPDYLPGHAHADTLSFELSLGGRRVIVNSGTSCYGSGPERLRQRGTAAHSTVVVADADSSEVWGGFRVARRARPRDVSITQRDDAVVVTGSHDGYRRLPGRPTHTRTWTVGAGSLRIDDAVDRPELPAVARFHLHPDVVLQHGEDADTGTGVLPDGRRFAWSVGHGRAAVEASSWHPRFGSSMPSRCLTVTLVDGRSSLSLRWGTDDAEGAGDA